MSRRRRERRCRKRFATACRCASAPTGRRSRSRRRGHCPSRSCRGSRSRRLLCSDPRGGRPMAERSEPLLRGAAGQAQLELIAGIPTLLLASLIALQLLAVGYAQTLADGAAEAGAIAAADGRDPAVAARSALPGWTTGRIDVEATGGEVRVELDPPTLLPGLGGRLGIESRAYAKPEGG